MTDYSISVTTRSCLRQIKINDSANMSFTVAGDFPHIEEKHFFFFFLLTAQQSKYLLPDFPS